MGTPGELYAKNLILNWMQEIGLENITQERITGPWTRQDTWENLRNALLDPSYYPDAWIGDLDLKKNHTKWYLNIKVYDKKNNLVDSKYFSQSQCFPFLKSEFGFGSHNTSIKDVLVSDRFLIGRPHIVLMEADWRDPYMWWLNNRSKLRRPSVKGFILMDCHDDTIFMMGSGTSTSYLLQRFEEAGISINGSSGKWIKKYLHDSNYVVKADLCSEWEWEKVESYNLIGEIPGKSDKIAIINAFYDGWWNQATSDVATSVGAILGLAKYIKDNGIVPELTLKFIFWGSHEWFFHGAKHYIKTHEIKKYGTRYASDNVDKEDILYVISPGNFGFNYTNDMQFNVGHPRDKDLQAFMQNVASGLQYTKRTKIGLSGDYYAYGLESFVFYHGHRYPERYCKHAIEFDRWPYPGYHRDGANHTKGDVFSEINDTLYRVDCEVVSEICLRSVSYTHLRAHET